ncbi:MULTISPECIES: hypothetical protein [Pseudomonas]|uniref:Uncharacterized protein n=1 Tax=Pseudomonas tritici TaxID=2745518 RepID=A0A8H9Z0E9_9PSED|nr:MULTISPECIES: hypothetical protein [Pseudomonas]QXH82029.1 hypothetical protein HU722_0018730 [Pseudomonas tritici]
MFSYFFHTFAIADAGAAGLPECEYCLFHVVVGDAGAWDYEFWFFQSSLCHCQFFNPMGWANKVMLVGVAECWLVVLLVVVLLVVSFFLMFRFLRINPVWSRY